MASFFADRRGTMVRIPGAALPFQVVMTDSQLGTVSSKSIYTQWGLVERGNFKLSDSVGTAKHVSVFGDFCGDIRVSGVCFTGGCSPGGESTGTESGMKQVIDAYYRLRASARSVPAQVSLGEMSYIVLIERLTMDVTDPVQNMGQWSMAMKSIPGNQPNTS